MSRMMCYAWLDPDANNQEVKFGDHFVPLEKCTLADAIAHTRKYIRSAQFPRRGFHFDDRVTVEYWDVSEYAKAHKKFHKASKIDDVIRPSIGHRGKVGQEFHTCTIDELVIKVNKELAKLGQPLPVAGLGPNQYFALENVTEAFADGKKTVLAELCARFGKTIWAGGLVRETNAPLTIVATYVLTVTSSFMKDLTSFKQFQDIVHVDTKDDDYEEQVQQGLKDGKQVIAYFSMCKGGKRTSRINSLFNTDVDKLLIVDEADFGVHQTGQSKPLIDALGNNDRVVLMTGTNADKAASTWNVDHILSITYPELLIEKNNPSDYSNATTLKNFKLDPSRNDKIVEVEFYQMGLESIVALAQADEMFTEDDELPSWSKFAAAPPKGKGFWVNMLEAVFLGKHNADECNIDQQTKNYSDDTRVAMMFLPGSMRNDSLDLAGQYARQALPGYEVIVVNGNNTSNKKAELLTKQTIEHAKESGNSVLILSCGMASRSYSVPEITELYLAYDSGDNAATIQKMSRALTPAGDNKVGRVISLSFDANRDDKFDALLLETAINYKKNNKQKSLREAFADVIRTIDIFDCQPKGAVKIDPDDYLKHAMANNSVSRVIGKTSNIFLLDDDELKALAQGNGDYFRNEIQERTTKGKTRHNAKKNAGKKKKNTQLDIKKAREVIVNIVENIDIIIFGTEANTLQEAFTTLDNNKDYQEVVYEEFGVEYHVINHLFNKGVINSDFVELVNDRA